MQSTADCVTPLSHRNQWGEFMAFDDHESFELRAMPPSNYVEFRWWAEAVDASGLNLVASRNQVMHVDGAKSPCGVVIETKSFILSRNITVCQPTELHYQLELRLTYDPEGTTTIDCGPTVVAAWPKKGTSAPLRVNQKVSKGARVGVVQSMLEANIGCSSETLVEHQFHETESVTLVGEPSRIRDIESVTRCSSTRQSLEGDHFGGFWITHTEKCFLRVRAIKAEVVVNHRGRRKIITPKKLLPELRFRVE